MLNPNHADFQVAQDIAELIDNQFTFAAAPDARRINSGDRRLARAIDAVNIEVTIPPALLRRPRGLVSQVLSLPMRDPQTASRRGDQRARRHGRDQRRQWRSAPSSSLTKNLVIEAGQPHGTNRFVGVDTATKPTAKLKSLVEALDALKVRPKTRSPSSRTLTAPASCTGR